MTLSQFHGPLIHICSLHVFLLKLWEKGREKTLEKSGWGEIFPPGRQIGVAKQCQTCGENISTAAQKHPDKQTDFFRYVASQCEMEWNGTEKKTSFELLICMSFPNEDFKEIENRSLNVEVAFKPQIDCRRLKVEWVSGHGWVAKQVLYRRL